VSNGCKNTLGVKWV